MWKSIRRAATDVLETKRLRLRWLGHVLRMNKDSIPKVALRQPFHQEEGSQDDQRQHGGRR